MNKIKLIYEDNLTRLNCLLTCSRRAGACFSHFVSCEAGVQERVASSGGSRPDKKQTKMLKWFSNYETSFSLCVNDFRTSCINI
jgi:hypothetical protein